MKKFEKLIIILSLIFMSFCAGRIYEGVKIKKELDVIESNLIKHIEKSNELIKLYE